VGNNLDRFTVSSLEMPNSSRVAWCSLAILVGLYIVGAVSTPPGSLRHEVQTLPLWLPIVFGFRGQDVTKWMALPMLTFWLAIMTLIWLFLLGWARIVTGHFFPAEIVMTLVVGAASLTGLIVAARWRTSTRPMMASALLGVSLLLQLLAFRVSLIPYIGSR